MGANWTGAQRKNYTPRGYNARVGLTSRQEAFVHEFLVDRNATRAAIRAGYRPKGARVQASRMIANANVVRAIESASARQFEAIEVTATMIVQRLWRLATDLSTPPAAQVSALALLAKRHPEFSEKRELSGRDGGPMELDIRAIVALRDDLVAERKRLEALKAG
jgi:phage terminase small subunit